MEGDLVGDERKEIYITGWEGKPHFGEMHYEDPP